jgi:hypothetical protein
MLTPEERALLMEQQDRLIELLTERQEFTKVEDWDRVRELQIEIEDAQGQLEIIRQLDGAVAGRPRGRNRDALIRVWIGMVRGGIGTMPGGG